MYFLRTICAHSRSEGRVKSICNTLLLITDPMLIIDPPAPCKCMGDVYTRSNLDENENHGQEPPGYDFAARKPPTKTVL